MLAGAYLMIPKGMSMTISVEDIKQKLHDMLDSGRYQHSLGTADTAKSLARYWQLDEEKAYLAGLLHDYAKSYTKEQLLSMSLRRGIAVDDWCRDYPGMLHGPVAAAELTDTWEIEDAEIAESIRCHTVPTVDMCDLAKVVYLADKIEPNRRAWDGLDRLRELAYTNLDLAMAAALDSCIEYILGRGKAIHPSTKEICEIYRNKIKRQKSHKSRK